MINIFEKMFGRGATQAAQQPNAQQRFDQLKQKYQTVLHTVEQNGIRLQNLHLQDDKLFIKGVAPSEDAKNKVWDQIKLVDASYGDLTADFSVEQSRTMGAAAGTGSSQGGQTYSVKSGDTLSKISKQFYGDADEYMRIFYANRNTLSDPNKIQVGQQLVIPPDDDA